LGYRAQTQREREGFCAAETLQRFLFIIYGMQETNWDGTRRGMQRLGHAAN